MNVKRKAVLLVVDTHALVHRVYHALPDLTTPQGEPIQAVFGLASMILKIIKEQRPTHVVCAFDTPVPTFRHKAFPAYKATRPKTPGALLSQFPKIKMLVAALRIPALERAGYEADDLIGTIVEQIRMSNKDADIRILSGDLDMLQLVDERTRVLTLRRGVSDIAEYDSARVFQRFGVEPEQFVAYKTLVGDASDNIPGVYGIGPKGAREILAAFPSLAHLEGILTQQEPMAHKKGALEKLRFFLKEHPRHFAQAEKLLRIDRNVPQAVSLEDFLWRGPDVGALEKLFLAWGFRSLLSRIPGRVAPSEVSVARDERRAALLAQIHEAEQTGLFSREIAALERNLVLVIERMEEKGILIDLPYVARLKRDFSTRLNALRKEIQQLASAPFNPGSPSQVSAILFEKLGLSSKGLKRTALGALSTGAEELEKIRSAHPIVEKILAWREIAKLLSTYIETLPKLVDQETHRVHTTFRQLGTDTGRISSANPNLQNIPIRTELGRMVRSAFVAEEGSTFVSADYSQIELRVIAHLSSDEGLCESFRKGEDIHRWTAAQVFGISLKGVTPTMRAQAKTLNFGLLYGMGPRRFAQEARLSTEEAEEFLARYRARFPGVMRFLEESLNRARQNLYAETLFGRRRMLPEIISTHPRLRSAAERAAVNMPVQGTAADIVKRAMIAVSELLERDTGSAAMLLQVHDELLFEVKEQESSVFAKEVSSCMEHVVTLSVPLAVTVKIAQRWGEMVE